MWNDNSSYVFQLFLLEVDGRNVVMEDVSDGSIKPIDISDWENLAKVDQIEVIERDNADDLDAKEKYGLIVINAINLFKGWVITK